MFGHLTYGWEADVVEFEVPAVVCFADGYMCVCGGSDAVLSERWGWNGGGGDACASSEGVGAL